MDQLVIPFLIFVFVFTTCLFDIVDIVRINSVLVTCGSKSNVATDKLDYVKY